MWRKLLALALVPWLASAKTEVSFLFSYDPNHPEMPATRRILELVKSEPEIAPVRWGGLSLPGGGGRTAFTLALAADSAPDVYLSWFHILRHDVEQGFVYPLDEWLSEGELRAEPSDLWDRVRRYDGHVWALPTPGVAYYGIVYRKDLVAAAGLDPECPPRTWSAFRDWCEKLTVPASGTDPGRQAFAIENRAWGFLPWVQSAGGDVIRVRDTGDEVRGAEAYEACFDSPAALKAAGYLQDLVRRGVVRGLPNLTKTDEIGRLFQSGEIVSVFGGEDLVRRLTETLHLPAKNIGLMPFPAADEGGVRVLQAHRHFYAMSESVRRRPKAERDRVWQCLCALASPELADEEVRRNVDEGRLQWCRPSDLRRLGYGDRLGEVPAGIREMYDDLERGEIKAVTEPWVGFWQAAGDLVQRRFLGLLLSSASGKDFDYAAALASITEDANRGLMFDSDRSRVDAARPYARIVFGALLACALVAAGLVWKVKRPASGASAPPNLRISESPDLRNSAPRARSRALAPWLFLAPAVLSILVWSYYPLVRGGVMAGKGQGQQALTLRLVEFTRLHGGEEVGLILIAVDGEVAEGHPGQAGHRAGVGRGRRLGLGQDAVIFTKASLVFQIPAVKHGKILVELRPHQGKGLVIVMEGGVQGREGVVIPQLPVLHGQLELRLAVQVLCHQPQIGGEEFDIGGLHRAVQVRDVHFHRQGVPRGRHLGKVVKDLPPGPGAQVDGRECHISASFPLHCRATQAQGQSTLR